MSNILVIGDKVTLSVHHENREWGYNPGPDGTILEIIGFSEIVRGYAECYKCKPGFWENKCWVDVKFPNGEIKHISSIHLKLDSQISNERYEKIRSGSKEFEEKYIKELPETKFWVDDVVSFGSIETTTVISIDYTENVIYYQLNNGRKCTEDKLNLISRGNVWKYYHNESLNFISVDEIFFYHRIGKTTEIANPRHGLYSWIKEEKMPAIQKGIVDCFLNMNLAVKFDQKDFGDKVRQYCITKNQFGFEQR